MPVRTQRHAEPLQRARHVSARRVDGERHDRRRGRDRSDDSHRADREAAVEGCRGRPSRRCRRPPRAGGLRHPGKASPESRPRRGRRPGRRPVRPRARVSTARRRAASPPRKSPTPQPRAPPSARRPPRGSVADRARRGLRVELVRVVEDSRLGGSGGGAVVMARDGVQQLGENGRIEITSALLDHPQPEMDVAEESSLVGRSERRAWTELADPADVVQERRGEHEVVRGAADGAAPSRGRASRRRPSARGGHPRSRGARPRRRRAGSGGPFGCRHRERTSRRPRRGPRCEISAARNSKKPSSSSASRRRVGVSEDGSASSAASTVRT